MTERFEWDIQLSELNYDSREKEAVNSVIKSGWLTMGENVKNFEDQFSSYLSDSTFCASVSSCTSALHLSLLAAGVKDGDEVISPSLTFVASVNAIMQTGAKPVLADCHSMDEWNVSLETIKVCVTERTKAIIVVHFAGYPCRIDEIADFCYEKGIVLIEDVAHAPGASYKDKLCGTWGDFACFSFFSNKNIAIGEGGMVATPHEDKICLIKSLRSHGMSSLTIDRHKGRAATYNVNNYGYNYRLDEMRGALGSVQLSKLKEGNKLRENLTNRYRENLEATEINMPFAESQAFSSSYHILPILLPKTINRDELMNFLKKNRIQSSVHYPSFCSFEAYKSLFCPKEIPIAEEICKRELTLPLHPNLLIEQVDKVSNKLKSYLDKL